jgi:hypothetical protein
VGIGYGAVSRHRNKGEAVVFNGSDLVVFGPLIIHNISAGAIQNHINAVLSVLPAKNRMVAVIADCQTNEVSLIQNRLKYFDW